MIVETFLTKVIKQNKYTGLKILVSIKFKLSSLILLEITNKKVENLYIELNPRYAQWSIVYKLNKGFLNTKL